MTAEETPRLEVPKSLGPPGEPASGPGAQGDKTELDRAFAGNKKDRELYLRRQRAEIEAIELANTGQQLANAGQECRNTATGLENWRLRIDLFLRCVAAVAIPLGVGFWFVRVLDLVTRQQAAGDKEPHLSDPAIVALLGTTSITVVGMVGIVARYLFTAKGADGDATSPGREKRA